MAIYDCFQYFNEDHIVDLRLHILDKFVDHFIISESTKTHQGKDKKINFDKNNLKNVEYQSSKLLTIPVHQFLDNTHMHYVLENIFKFYGVSYGD